MKIRFNFEFIFENVMNSIANQLANQLFKHGSHFLKKVSPVWLKFLL